MRAVIVSLGACLALSTAATLASAQTDSNEVDNTTARVVSPEVAASAPAMSNVHLLADVAALADPFALQQAGSPRPVAFEYSDIRSSSTTDVVLSRDDSSLGDALLVEREADVVEQWAFDLRRQCVVRKLILLEACAGARDCFDQI